MYANAEAGDREGVEVPLVLVVDDDPFITRMVRLTLRGDGFDVVTAQDGLRALEEVGEHLPDAIVLDLEMPVMDGRTFMRVLRERGITVPVIIVTAAQTRAARHELGAQAYLAKPFDPDDLVSSVRELIACA